MAGKVIICDNNVSASGGGRGLKTVELSSYRVYRAKLSSYRTIEYIQNCELSGKVIICDNNVSASGGGCGLKTVELSNYRVYRVEQNCRVIELSSISSKTVELSNYRAGTSKATVAISVTRMLEQIEKLSRYRTIEQGLQNCRNIGHSSKVILY